MKIILDIKEDRISFFIELIKNFDFISNIKEVNEDNKSQFVEDLAEAFNDIRLHEQGEKKLKSAKELLNEL